jgi:catalase-peroxidase
MFKKNVKRVLVLALAFSQIANAKPNLSAASESTDRSNVSNQFWWPERLDLAPLRQHAVESSPLGKNFDYAKEFKKLDIIEVLSNYYSAQSVVFNFKDNFIDIYL